jgi:hypothetical protein
MGHHYIEVLTFLTDQQTAYVKPKNDGYRLEGATCCKCTNLSSCPLSSKLYLSQKFFIQALYRQQHLSQRKAYASMSVQMKELSGFRDVWDPLLESDVPVFWHIPKAGGSTFKNIMGACHRLVLASATGIKEGHANDTELAIVKIGGDPASRIEPSRFVNVDTTHLPCLEKAQHLGLVKSPLTDVIVVRHLFEAENLFNPQQRGRVFAVFRHPVERSTSMFNYIKVASWEPTYNTEIARMTLEDYVTSHYMEQD